VVGGGGGSRGVEDAVCQLCARFHSGVRPEEGVEDLGVGADAAAGADDGVDDGGGRVDGGVGVEGGACGAGGEGEEAVGAEVGLAGAQVEPIAIVEDAGPEAAGGGELEEGGDDGDFFARGNEGEDVGLEAVDAGELVGAGVDAPGVAEIDDAVALHGDVAVGAGGAEGEGGFVAGGSVGGEKLGEGEVGEDVAIVDKKRFFVDPRFNIFDAAAGFEEEIFVEKGEGGVTVAAGGEGGGPGVGEVVGVDGEVGEAGSEAVVEGVGDEGAVENRDEGFWEEVGHGAQAGAEARAKKEGLAHGRTVHGRRGAGNRQSEKLGGAGRGGLGCFGAWGRRAAGGKGVGGRGAVATGTRAGGRRVERRERRRERRRPDDFLNAVKDLRLSQIPNNANGQVGI